MRCYMSGSHFAIVNWHVSKMTIVLNDVPVKFEIKCLVTFVLLPDLALEKVDGHGLVTLSNIEDHQEN